LKFVPDASLAEPAEIASRGPDPTVDASACEYAWSCFVFPIQAGSSGSPATDGNSWAALK
jgi:hypothetical protein